MLCASESNPQNPKEEIILKRHKGYKKKFTWYLQEVAQKIHDNKESEIV